MVVSATGSPPFLVHPHETGLLFRPQAADDLAVKSRWLYEHPDQIDSMGHKARALVESKYDSRLRYSALRAIVDDVIKTSRMN